MEFDVERFSTVPLFEGLTPQEIRDLLRIAIDVKANEGDEIVRQGNSGDAFYVIGAGEFDVLKTGDKERIVLARLQQLSYFGEMSLVNAAPRSASVICVTSGRLKKFPTGPFNKLLADGNLTAFKVIRNMCRILAQRLARLEDRIVS